MCNTIKHNQNHAENPHLSTDRCRCFNFDNCTHRSCKKGSKSFSMISKLKQTLQLVQYYVQYVHVCTCTVLYIMMIVSILVYYSTVLYCTVLFGFVNDVTSVMSINTVQYFLSYENRHTFEDIVTRSKPLSHV